MKREATVVARKGKLVAQVIRGDACGSCHGCEFGRKETVYVALPPGHYTEGERIELTLDAGNLPRASLIAYGVPFLFLIAGLIAGFLLFDSEGLQALCAIAALAIGALLIALTEKKRRVKGDYAPCAERKSDQGGSIDGD